MLTVSRQLGDHHFLLSASTPGAEEFLELVTNGQGNVASDFLAFTTGREEGKEPASKCVGSFFYSLFSPLLLTWICCRNSQSSS